MLSCHSVSQYNSRKYLCHSTDNVVTVAHMHNGGLVTASF
jgi:hypothetical protein